MYNLLPIKGNVQLVNYQYILFRFEINQRLRRTFEVHLYINLLNIKKEIKIKTFESWILITKYINLDPLYCISLISRSEVYS